jgi:aryl-alcohol dehydrogenase-like predicted oxidoreductase
MKIALGTVQFGMSYGISNQSGQTKKLEVGRILEYASKEGINMLDTAPSYLRSENVIGELCNNFTSSDYWDVITKTPNFKGVNAIGNKQVEKLIESFELSRDKLKQKCMYGLLIHSCDDLFLPGGDKLFYVMEQLKKDGVVKKIGVSLYDSSQIDRVLDNFSIDLVQLPVSILDQRLIKSGHLKKLKKYGVEIHARSVFLQGLLLMPLKNLPLWFKPIFGKLKRFHDKAEELNMTKIQLALGFVQSIDEVDKVVIGVNTIKQLLEIVNAISAQIDTDEFSHYHIDNSIFTNPSNWKK